MKKFSSYTIVIFSVLFFYSCKQKKEMIGSDKSKVIPIEEIYNNIFNPKDIDWFSGRAKLRFSSNYDSQKAVMFVRLKTDSILWTSFKKFGAEGARALITKDSIFTINRLEKSFQKQAIQEIYNQFGITPDLESIQNLAVGRLPELDTMRLWEEWEDENFYFFRSAKDDIIYNFSYDKYTGQMAEGNFLDRNGLKGFWNYRDYIVVNDYSVPNFRKYTVKFDDTNYINLTIEFTDIEINKPQSTKFSIPSHYKSE